MDILTSSPFFSVWKTFFNAIVDFNAHGIRHDSSSLEVIVNCRFIVSLRSSTSAEVNSLDRRVTTSFLYKMGASPLTIGTFRTRKTPTSLAASFALRGGGAAPHLDLLPPAQAKELERPRRSGEAKAQSSTDCVLRPRRLTLGFFNLVGNYGHRLNKVNL